MSQDLVARRARLMGPNVPTFYDRPVHLVRGSGVWLWDADGNRYLDAYNNVPHVGHCHPKVVAAISDQAAQLNTHTRYLHDKVLDYLERITARLGPELSRQQWQGIMVCTGSEANDIALRMGQAMGGATGLIATDNTYHGNTAAVSGLNTRRPPIGGRPGHVRLVPAPESGVAAGTMPPDPARFAADVGAAIGSLQAAGHGLAALILCPFLANEGFATLPRGFFDAAADQVRAAGGIVIADEVQPGFGRLGDAFWGFQHVGLTPDVVTIGKPMANGHPVAAVLARPQVMAAFREAFGYFNTFGGNPVAAAAALATLEVLEDEGLVPRAMETGHHLLTRLSALSHPFIGQVRGAGLFLGVEFIDDQGAPAAAFTAGLVEAMRDRGVLLNRIGRGGNTLKIRPPMPFGPSEADLLADRLVEALAATRVHTA